MFARFFEHSFQTFFQHSLRFFLICFSGNSLGEAFTVYSCILWRYGIIVYRGSFLTALGFRAIDVSFSVVKAINMNLRKQGL